MSIIKIEETAYTNKKQGERDTFGEKLIFSLLEIVLPPHRTISVQGIILSMDWEQPAGLNGWLSVRIRFLMG